MYHSQPDWSGWHLDIWPVFFTFSTFWSAMFHLLAGSEVNSFVLRMCTIFMYYWLFFWRTGNDFRGKTMDHAFQNFPNENWNTSPPALLWLSEIKTNEGEWKYSNFSPLDCRRELYWNVWFSAFTLKSFQIGMIVIQDCTARPLECICAVNKTRKNRTTSFQHPTCKRPLWTSWWEEKKSQDKYLRSIPVKPIFGVLDP